MPDRSQPRSQTKFDQQPINMVKQKQMNPIPDRSSPGSTRTASDVGVPGHPSTSGLQDTAPQVGQPGPSAAGRLEEQTAKRQKYSAQENRAIMACYYKSEPHKRGYLKRMHQLWKELHPDTKMTEQRLADQRRFIERNRVFSEVELEEIRRHIAEEVQDDVTTPGIAHESEQLLNETAMVVEPIAEPQEDGNEIPVGLTPRQQDLKDKIMAHAQSGMKRERLPALKAVPKKDLAPIMKDVNAALAMVTNMTIEQLNQVMYSAAVVVTEELGVKLRTATVKPKPKWKIRLELKIKRLRADASNLKNMKEQKLKNGKTKKKLIKKYWLGTRKIDEALEIVKQQLTATARKIERYEARIIQYRQNHLFQSDQRRFFQSINSTNNISTCEKPPKQETNQFWKNLWGERKDYNRNAGWLRDFEKQFRRHKMADLLITAEMIKSRVKKIKNWTAPGSDQLHGFWLKYLTSLHPLMAKQFNDMLLNGEISEWLTTGVTYLIQKDAAKGAVPGNYRPITCLPTMFKLLTGIIADSIQDYLADNDIMPVEQKGNKRNSRGTKDQLLIDKMILENCRRRKTNLHMVWIDYKKAFDSLPHSWIIKCLETTGVSRNIIEFIEKSMSQWKTELMVGTEEYGPVSIKRGIFQGDSLSPLLFIIALIPLTLILRKTKLGYQTAKDSEKISHLLYMDDLKLYGKSEAEIQSLTNTVRIFSADISMEFGLDKCATVALKKGKISESAGIEMPDGQMIRSRQDEAYKYLGILQMDNIKHAQVKTIVSKEYQQRVRKILRSKLNGGNTIRAINIWAIPVIRYTAGIVNWTQTDLDALDRKTRKLMTIHYSLHPCSDVDRLYLPRSCGGRGLLQVKQTVEEEKHALTDYVNESQQHALIAVKNQKILKAQQTKREYRKTVITARMEAWRGKALHGQFLEKIKDKVDHVKTWSWLAAGTLKKETEGLILAAQEQAIRTNAIKARIEMSTDDTKCRLCKESDETVAHILSSCKKIANIDYKHRHNAVAKMVHWNLCKNYDIQVTNKWWQHQPKKVMENDRVKVLWDFRIQTDKKLAHNMPDITIIEPKKVCIIDIAVPDDSRVDDKQQEKIAKYQDLKIEVQRLWHKRAEVVPVVIGALGAVPKDLGRHLKHLNIDKISICQLQKAALLGSANILRRYITSS